MGEKVIKLRGHHLFNIGFVIINKRSLEEEIKELESAGFSKEFAVNLYNICKEITENEDLQIRIVDTIDDICSYCNKKNLDCTYHHSSGCEDEDHWISRISGLNLSKIYSAKQIIKAIMPSNMWKEFLKDYK